MLQTAIISFVTGVVVIAGIAAFVVIKLAGPVLDKLDDASATEVAQILNVLLKGVKTFAEFLTVKESRRAVRGGVNRETEG